MKNPIYFRFLPLLALYWVGIEAFILIGIKDPIAWMTARPWEHLTFLIPATAFAGVTWALIDITLKQKAEARVDSARRVYAKKVVDLALDWARTVPRNPKLFEDPLIMTPGGVVGSLANQPYITKQFLDACAATMLAHMRLLRAMFDVKPFPPFFLLFGECAEQLAQAEFGVAEQIVIDANLDLIRQEIEAHASQKDTLSLIHI